MRHLMDSPTVVRYKSCFEGLSIWSQIESFVISVADCVSSRTELTEMFNLKISVLLLTAICYSHVRHCHGTIQEVKASYTFGDEVFFDGAGSFSRGIFVYVLCDSNTGNIANCKVIQTKYPYEENSYSCDVTLETNRDGRPAVGVSVVGKEKVVLYWWHAGDGSFNTSIGTVDLRTCKFSRAINIRGYYRLTFLEFLYLNKLVPYSDGSFDIFYHDPRYHPETADLYKIQIGGDGKIKIQPTAVNVERGRYYYTSSVATGSPSKGYIYVKRNQMDYSKNATFYVWLVKPDGSRLQLAQYNRYCSDVSVDNNLISLCHKAEAESHVSCNQYDENGNVRFSTIFYSGQNTDFIQSYNLPNGGLLVMYGAKDCNQLDSCHSIFKVTKIGSNGKKIGSLQLKVDIANMFQIVAPYIYMNESGTYCATVIDWNFRMTSEKIPIHLTILSKCFTEDDLRLSNDEVFIASGVKLE